MLSRFFIVTLSAAAVAVSAASNATVKCPLVFDGRIPASLKLTDFDASGGGSPFGPEYVKGQGLKWSDILQLPSVANSRFDNASFKSVEVTLSDKSVFQNQHGFRRAGLQFNGDSNSGSPAYAGVKTLHFSVKQDPQRALNLSHEYLVGAALAFASSSSPLWPQTNAALGRTCGTRPATTRPTKSCSRPEPS